MDFERMSFRTPNYSDAIMDSLLKLQQGGVFCDAVLKGKDVEAKVHKVILMATDCEFFKEQMTKSDMGNTTENPCIVEIDTESQVDLDCLVKELYTGCLELTTSNVRNMFKIYETLKMNDQLKFCHQFENFLLRPPDPNKSSEFTGLDMLDESKVSAIVCEGSDIVQVIKEEVADDTDIRDILESSLKQTEILQGADIEMSDNENKTLKSEELKGEELSSGVQQWEVAQIAISEKGEGEQIASGGDGGRTEESQSEIENVDESTVKSENGDVEDDDMEGFEVVDEYIEDEQEENKEKVIEAPPAKKLKNPRLCRKKKDTKKIKNGKGESNEDISLKCDQCDRTFLTRRTLGDHIRVKHSGGGQTCPTCGLQCASKSALERHVQEVHRNQKFSCEICFKLFVRPWVLKNHIEYAHKGKGVECEICGKKYATRNHLNEHLVTHTTGRGEICKKCGKAYKHKRSLRKHFVDCNPDKVKRRKEQASGICPHCGKSFKNRKYLQAHLTMHSSEKPLQCDICGKTFKWPASYLRHIRICSNKKAMNKYNDSLNNS